MDISYFVLSMKIHFLLHDFFFLFLNVALPWLLSIVLLYYFVLNVQTQKKKYRTLLTNVLPAKIADKLLASPCLKVAQQYENVTILFMDIVGFTQWSNDADPYQLIETLHMIFSLFDEVSIDCKLEKIKTIGDAYMAAAGLFLHLPNAAITTCHAVSRYCAALERVNSELGTSFFQMKIGVSTGSVVGGVVGLSRLQFDCWGACVNRASRLEQIT
jgi:adenylate cyclase